jgi:glycosyltransferase involved in cell wall biosynthesis
LYRRLLRIADGLIFGACSQRDAWYARYGLASPARRDMVLYNGVDLDEFDASSAIPSAAAPTRPPARLLIGSVGKLRPEKSHGDLVDAVRILRDRGLDVAGIVVGDGPERPRLEERIERLALAGNFILPGEVADVRPYLRMMDVFALTSTSVETFSNAALEAMSAGLPVVSANIGGMSEMLDRGGGKLYPPGNVEGLCAVLTPLLRDPVARLQMGRDARRVVLERFSWGRMVDDFLAYASPVRPTNEGA